MLAKMMMIIYIVKEQQEAPMRVSREQVAEHRRMILEAAGRLFRERGFETVTVAEVMQAAGLTHGGFYRHFKSKDDLIAQTLAHALADDSVGEADLARYATEYLTPAHRDNVSCGCSVAGLGAETIRQSPEARAAMTAALQRQIERLSEGAPGAGGAEKRQAAIASWSAMVGAMVLARLCDDPKLSDEVLAQTRAFIRKQAGEDA